MAKFRKGQIVEWRFPPGVVKGEVQESFAKTVRLEIKGRLVTRHGTK